MATPSPSARIAWSTRRLGRTAERLAPGRERAVAALCRQVLAAPDGGEDPLPDRSRLNNDGVPLQLCLTSSRTRAGLRLIGDPGAHLDDTEARWRVSRAALDEALTASGAGTLAPLAERTLARLLPDAPEPRARYRDGFIWLARSPDRPGLAFYVEAAPLGAAGGWDAAEAWLSDVLPAPAAARAALARLRASCVVASLGLEGSCPADARAKIYFRLARPASLEALGLELLRDASVQGFLAEAMGTFGLDLDGLVLSAGFRVATGEPADVKLDLCGHCLTWSDAQWLALWERWRAAHGLRPLPLADALQGDCDVAFVGFGLDAALEPRVNVYLKARAPREAPRPDELRAALDDGLRYLCGLQDERGAWRDYRLPVGASDQWVTAYVGLALAQCARRLAHPAALEAARRAADWLDGARTYAAGWGYNGETGPDADSTALALALRRELGLNVRAEDQAWLRAHWRPGGIATYEGPAAWGQAHWDVTPWGYLGLAGDEQRALRGEFLAALAHNRQADGTWRAYWWRTPLYSTLMTLEALEALGLPEPAAPGDAAPLVVDNAFDLACALGVLALRGAPAERRGAHLRALVDAQAADGRWPGHANLRVTDDACAAPWDEPVGECYRDEAATLTTATAVRVLARVLDPRAAEPYAAPEVNSGAATKRGAPPPEPLDPTLRLPTPRRERVS
jgi:hypothetical protein